MIPAAGDRKPVMQDGIGSFKSSAFCKRKPSLQNATAGE
jgi:hypothetical protein